MNFLRNIPGLDITCNTGKSAGVMTAFIWLSVSLMIHAAAGIVFFPDNFSASQEPVVSDETLRMQVVEIEESKPDDVVIDYDAAPVKEKKTVSAGLADDKRQNNKIKPAVLEALGRGYLDKIKEGRFPSLTLSYPDPASFIQQMYGRGAKTLLFDRIKGGNLYEVNLIAGTVSPFDKNRVEGFSLFKRVIKDVTWNSIKKRYAVRLSSQADRLDIILLIPQQLELLWVGHQVDLCREMQIDISEVSSVEALIQNGRFKVQRLYMQDGRRVEVGDPNGVG